MDIFESSISADEISSAIGNKTMVDFFFETVARCPDRLALRAKTDSEDSGTDRIGSYDCVSDDDGNDWRTYTWSQYGDAARRFATALTSLGVQDDERVMMLLRNCPAFHIVDVGTMIHGATPVSIYHSSSADQIKYLIEHSGASVIVVEHPAFAERVAAVVDQLPSLNHVIVVEDPATLSPDVAARLSGVGVHYLHDLVENAQPAQQSNATTPEDYATIIYTSGTTGPPKGVALKQSNITFTTESLVRRVERDPQGWRVVSYLPMAHIAERMVSHYLGIRYGWSLTCCPDATLVSQYLGPTKPHALFAVPRIWEKAFATINALVGDDRAEFDNALSIGLDLANRKARGEDIPQAEQDAFTSLDEQFLAPWRAVLGLDECIVAVSGAAPLPSEIMSFFRGLQLPVSEIYGLSETCGPLTWSPNAVRIGYVGEPIPGETVALAEDGEVLVKGGNIFEGYLNDEEKTREAIDDEGWFHTGDIGLFDDGQMRIVDRKKELIITAGGKNVSPANLEAHLKASPYVSAACVVGDGQKYLGALIALEADAVQFWAMMAGVEGTLHELAVHDGIKAEIQKAVDAANEHVSSAESIRKFVILDHEWLPDTDVLTPTMKLKRRVVKEKYAKEISSMFE